MHYLINKWLLWYLRYTDAAIEWSLWVNSLPSQRKEFYTKWQQQQSDEQYVHMKIPLCTFCIFILLFNLNQVERFEFPLCKVVFYYCSFRMVHRELQKIKCFNCILCKNLHFNTCSSILIIHVPDLYCIQGYFRPVLSLPYFICKCFRPILNLPRQNCE